LLSASPLRSDREEVNKMASVTYPHKMRRGVFKGRTFASQAAYQHALAGARNGNGASSALWAAQVIDAYEQLVAAGFGKRQSVKVIETLFEQRR
jgi:hypothetical protein